MKREARLQPCFARRSNDADALARRRRQALDVPLDKRRFVRDDDSPLSAHAVEFVPLIANVTVEC